LLATGASALEIAIVFPEQPRIDALKAGKSFMPLGYTSLHLPDYDPKKPVAAQVALASKICAVHQPKAALIHPSSRVKHAEGKPIDLQVLESMVPEAFYGDMKRAGVPLAIENMDKDKLSRYGIIELDELVRFYDLAFVLDAQHAFEQDADMGYAKELLDMQIGRLMHIHISGEVADDIPDRNHQLVHKSDNQEAILRFTHGLLRERNVPIIIEGKYADADELKTEIDFLRQELA
jgi:hypothetical protein